MPKLHLTGNRVIEISYAQWERLVLMWHKISDDRLVQIGGKDYRKGDILGLEEVKPPKFGQPEPLQKKPATRQLKERKYQQPPQDMHNIPPIIQGMMDKGLNVDWYFDSKRKRR